MRLQRAMAVISGYISVTSDLAYRLAAAHAAVAVSDPCSTCRC